MSQTQAQNKVRPKRVSFRKRHAAMSIDVGEHINLKTQRQLAIHHLVTLCYWVLNILDFYPKNRNKYDSNPREAHVLISVDQAQIFSTIIAMPWPPPMHAVASP